MYLLAINSSREAYFPSLAKYRRSLVAIPIRSLLTPVMFMAAFGLLAPAAAEELCISFE
jgi:hypothetical protein